MISKKLLSKSAAIEKLLTNYGYIFNNKLVKIDETFLIRTYRSTWTKNITTDLKYICEIDHNVSYKDRVRTFGVSIINSNTGGDFHVNTFISKKYPGLLRAPVSAKNHKERIEIGAQTVKALADVIEKDLTDLFLGNVWYGSNIHTQD